MSFPNIPDINPYINITFEEAVNLLLASIAMEEISLSKLIDAEKSKILCVLDSCKHHNDKNDGCGCDCCGHEKCLLYDAIKINSSVDDTIKDIIKLQMLLQFKLENIKEILPYTNSTTTTSTSTSTTTTTANECQCSIFGNGKGYVSNCCDEFYNKLSTLYAFINYCDIKNRTIQYFVGNDEVYLHMYASGFDVKSNCSNICIDKIVICGKGCIEKRVRCCPDIIGYAEFNLTVFKKSNDNLKYRMKIKSDKKLDVNHDSGFISVQNTNSDLIVNINK